MVAILLASVIANAFIISRFSPSNFYKLHRYDGQLLYIKATFIGVFSTAISLILDSYAGITDFISRFLPERIFMASFENAHLQAFFVFFLFAALISFLYCTLDWLILWIRARYRFHGMENPAYIQMARIMLMYKILSDSPLDRLLFMSYVQNKFLLITMSDRKVYVGRVISLGEPNESQGPDQEIAIVPVFSGYRDSQSLNVTLNRTYSGNEEAEDAFLVLKQDNIVSACEFIASLYEKLSNKEPAK